VPKSSTTIIWTPIFEWYVVKCASKRKTPKWHVCKKKDKTTRSKYANLSRLNVMEATYTTT
jgi:hypothetical protein